jgi:hypothetical protein
LLAFLLIAYTPLLAQTSPDSVTIFVDKAGKANEDLQWLSLGESNPLREGLNRLPVLVVVDDRNPNKLIKYLIDKPDTIRFRFDAKASR